MLPRLHVFGDVRPALHPIPVRRLRCHKRTRIYKCLRCAVGVGAHGSCDDSARHRNGRKVLKRDSCEIDSAGHDYPFAAPSLCLVIRPVAAREARE